MIFPYSFRKAYLANPVGGNLVVQTSGTTDIIQKGQFGLCSAPNGIEGSFVSGATTTTVKMVTGSWHTVDSIAPFYGGLQAPEYSKLIDFRRVTRFIKSTAASAQQQIVSFGWNQQSGSSVGPVFYCGQPYFLRLDLLGSPALRLLNHQLYVTLPAFGGCCNTDCSSGCTAAAVDAASIMLQWSDFMNYGTYSPGAGAPSMNSQDGQIPYLNQFFQPAVYIQSGTQRVRVYSAADVAAGVGPTVYVPNTSNPTSVIASFQLTGAYYQTNYGNCTFTPSDYFEIEPIFCKASLMTGDFGSDVNWGQCAVNTTINTSVPNMYTELQSARYPKGLGEQVVREIILSQRYRQDHFADSIYVDSFRMREIENQNWILDNVNRQGYYDSIALVYNINRPQNSQSVHNNDEYVEIIYVPNTNATNGTTTSTSTTTWTNLIQACLTAVNSPVVLENI